MEVGEVSFHGFLAESAGSAGSGGSGSIPLPINLGRKKIWRKIRREMMCRRSTSAPRKSGGLPSVQPNGQKTIRRSGLLPLPKILPIFQQTKHDEVSAIVIDLGSHTCKAGYAGEDAPKAVFPSIVGSIDQVGAVDDVKSEKESESMSDSKNGVRPFDSDKTKAKRKLYVGSQALGYRRDYMEVVSPIKDGVVVDWDIVDHIWDHAFRERY